LQARAAMTAEWAIGGPDRIPAAWAFVDSSSKGSFRVLWIGADDGRSFPAPGGDPQGVIDAGDATLRYGLTPRVGALAIDTARPFTGPGSDAMREALGEILSGTSIHGGALLAPFGVRYLVASDDQLNDAARARLDAQVDLDIVPAAGLAIWVNDAALPPAAVVKATAKTAQIVAAGQPSETQRLTTVPGVPLPQVQGGWSGPTGGGNLAVGSTEFDDAWTVPGRTGGGARGTGRARGGRAGQRRLGGVAVSARRRPRLDRDDRACRSGPRAGGGSADGTEHRRGVGAGHDRGPRRSRGAAAGRVG